MEGVVALQLCLVAAEQVRVQLLAECAVWLVLAQAQGVCGVQHADFVVELYDVLEALAWDQEI